MIRSLYRFTLIVVALLVGAGSLAAQPAPAPRPQATPRPQSAPTSELAPTPRPTLDRTYTFQLVLLVADTSGPNRFENVPPNARKALEDVRDFLPYKGYQLLDMAWLRSSRTAEAQLAGPEGTTYSARIAFRSVDEEPGRLDIQRFVIVATNPSGGLNAAPNREGGTAVALLPPVRPVIESTFGMQAGETVVVGTARLDGASRALIVLLSALP